MLYTARQKLKFLELTQNRLIEKETNGKDTLAASPKLVLIYIPKKLSTVTNSYSHLYTSFPRELTVQNHLAQKTCVNTSYKILQLLEYLKRNIYEEYIPFQKPESKSDNEDFMKSSGFFPQPCPQKRYLTSS